MKTQHWFQYVSNGVLILFLGILVLVTAIAYLRRSGSTGLDMTRIQKMRFDKGASSGDPS